MTRNMGTLRGAAGSRYEDDETNFDKFFGTNDGRGLATDVEQKLPYQQ